MVRWDLCPILQELENPQTNLASELITEDGEQLGKYFIENRTFVRFDELAPHLVDALVATEDVRYYKHSGIDLRSLLQGYWSIRSCWVRMKEAEVPFRSSWQKIYFQGIPPSGKPKSESRSPCHQ